MSELGEMGPEYRCLLAKLQELLRVYAIARKNDKGGLLQERVKAKSDEIVARLKAFPPFNEVEHAYARKVHAAFRDSEQPPSTHKYRPNDPPQKPKAPDPPKKNTFSSVSSHSSFSSSSSNASANVVPASKKQTPVFQQKIKAPSIVDKPKIQPEKSVQGFKSDVIQVDRVPQTSKVMNSLKIQTDSISSKSHSSLQEAKKAGSSISSIQNKPFFQKEKSSGNESFLGLLDQNSSSDGEFHLKLGPQKSEQKIETPQISSHSETPKQDEFDKLSETSGVQNTSETIANFCKENKDRLNTQIIFNEDIFDYTRDQEVDFVYLIGVNKPQGKKVQKLYACTLMKFSVHEVMKCDELFQKQTKDFKNNIRTPIGLIMKGDGAAAIQPEHIKFLVNLQCPFLVILVLKDFQKYDGVLCYFNENVVDRIRFTPRKQLGQTAEQLSKKTYALPFNESYLPKEKTRYVITKHLNRTIVSNAEEAPNAITISDNQCIREEKNPFSYKVHQKFLTNLKTENTIYYVNNGIVNSRLSYKNFQSFKAEALALKPSVPLIFSLTLARDNVPLKKEFFELLIQCNKIRDPNIFINLSNMSVKKCIVVTLKPDVTMEMLDKVEPLQLKNFEKDTPLTYCVLTISKNNFKDFEDPKAELNQLKSP